MGSDYPIFLEKIAFIGLLALSIYVGYILGEHLNEASLWFSWICGIPILLLVFTEGIGRVIQKIHTRK